MPSLVNTFRSKPAPPAAGQFGLYPPAECYELRAYRPAGCPSMEQFEARLLFAGPPDAPAKTT